MSQLATLELNGSPDALKGLVPLPTTPILGREKEIQELIGLLEQHKVVTITGTGGLGKTKLAIEICHRINAEIADDILFVSMATLTAAEKVMPVLVDVLGITETANRQLWVGVAEALSNKRVVLVLDNLEHIISAASEIVQLIITCPGMKVLCTSRTPLKISAEQEYALQTLPLPTQVEYESLQSYPAIELFVSRIKKVNRDFELTPENSETIMGICKYLDGLPLALELAAFRLRIITPQQLLMRLKQNINILSSKSKDLPVRHQTLKNTIEWSYELLNDAEQRLFRRLAVFTKGFSLEAIEQVCYDSDMDLSESLDGIESLIDKGLVQKMGANQRFTLLQTIKDFATDSWIASDEIEFISMKHAKFYCDISELIREGTQGKKQQERMSLGVMEEANVLSALDYLLEQARNNNEDARELGLRICGNLWAFWHIHGKHVTTKEYVNSFLETSRKDTLSAGKCSALFSLHVAYYTLGEIELSEAAAERLFQEAKTLGNQIEMSKGLFGLGFGNMFSDMGKSLKYNEEAMQLLRELNNSYWLALALWQNGIFNLISGNLETAKGSYSQSLEIFKSLNENEGKGIAQSGLCMLEFMAANYDRALELYSDTLIAFKSIGDRPEIARVLSEMAWTYLAKGDTHAALVYALKSIKAHKEIASDRGIGISLNAFAAIEAVKGRAKKAIEIAAAAKHFADQKGVAIELGVNNHGEIYLEKAKQQLIDLEIEEAEKAGKNYSANDILEMVEGKAKLKPYEDAFITRLKGAIEENFSNSTFGTSQLNEAVSMSQIQVYRKLKALKNQTPSQFIRAYRLQKGKALLQTSNKTIAEIAYEVGFDDPNYFSRIFAKEFSITPTAYRQQEV